MKRIITFFILVLTLTQVSFSDTVYSKEMEAKALKGDSFAQAQLGYCYATGSGIEKNYDKAFEWHNKSASNGNAYSMYCLGLMHLKGEVAQSNRYDGAKWFEKSYEKGYEKSKEYLDKIALPELRYDYRIIHLAEEGDTDAQYTLATWLWPSVTKGGNYTYRLNDEKRAFEWMKIAADNGELRAVRDLGSMFIEGVCVNKDPRMGYKYFSKAAALGDNEAQYLQGICLAQGIGVEKDEVEAVSLISKLAKNGHAQGMFELGYLYANGELGLSKDMTKAIEWYKKAAKAGSSNALVNLGYCYQKGIGVEKDLWKAVECYGESLQLGNEMAQNNIAAVAPEVAKKFPKYFKTLKSEAQNGDAKSQAIIGALYLTDVPRQYNIDRQLDPIQEGAKWILAAAKNGASDTYYLAGEICETGTGYSLIMDSNNHYQLNVGSDRRTIQKIDLPSAKMFYEKCAESDARNNWLGKFRLAIAYYNGEELVGNVDYKKSVNYLMPVIEFLEKRAPVCQELKEAYELMGKCYYNGRGVEENPQKGDEYIKKSARLGNTKPFEQKFLQSWSLE